MFSKLLVLAGLVSRAAANSPWASIVVDDATQPAHAVTVNPPPCEPPEVRPLGDAAFGWLSMRYSRNDATVVSATFVGSTQHPFREQAASDCARVDEATGGVTSTPCDSAGAFSRTPGGWLMRTTRTTDAACPVAVEALLPRTVAQWASDPATRAISGSLRQSLRTVRALDDVEHALVQDVAISTQGAVSA